MGRQKKINWNYARNMDVDAWRARQVNKRLAERLKRQEERFIHEHGEDSDAELTAYVQSKARELGRMPHPLELAGGTYLQRRLGDWRMLARRLGYCPLSRKHGQNIYENLKLQEEKAFAAERRSMKANKQIKAAAKDKPAEHSPADKEKEWKTVSE